MQGLTEKAPLAAVSAGRPIPSASANSGPFRAFFIVAGILALCFAKPLSDLLRLSWQEEIYSHIILIPFISVYLIGQRRADLPRPQTGPVGLALVAALVPLGVLALPFAFRKLGTGDILSLRILAFWMFLLIAALATLGWRFFRALTFPLFFLVFAVPLPPSVIDPLETASKIASTECYTWMMDITQSTYFRRDFTFALPGLTIEVAQECSGIRSSLVLFIVSTLAANLFLSTTWRRILFCLFVIPLGCLRNGFRIFTLSFLSVHLSRTVIDSPLHHKGGPIFFALSLIPFCLVLAWLRKSEYRRRGSRRTESVLPSL